MRTHRKLTIACLLGAVGMCATILGVGAAMYLSTPENLSPSHFLQDPNVPVPVVTGATACPSVPSVTPTPAPDTSPPQGAAAPADQTDANVQSHWDATRMQAAAPDVQQHAEACAGFQAPPPPPVGVPPISLPGTTPLPSLP
ncbi:MAG TPA: hypothetical protein VN193_15235 [Candidatus Angelobacter sp.]|nr:hypothetical protein [Candidatus Angelobacter sp.]